MKRLIAKADGNHEVVDLSEDEITERTEEKTVRAETNLIADNKEQAQAILNSTDWTQIPNSGLSETSITAFMNYRNSIRLIRMNNSATVDWPIRPVEEWV